MPREQIVLVRVELNLLLILLCLLLTVGMAQDNLTGAFQGTVKERATGNPLVGAQVNITGLKTNSAYPQVTDARGRFYQGRLAPENYRIEISYPGYQSISFEREIRVSELNKVIPIPVTLDLAGAATTSPPPPAAAVAVRAAINTTDGKRSGSFVDHEVTRLPLGGVTFVRTFDELTTLLPGVAPPPQTLGSVAGPGVGAGVGTAGQFSVNGLRSRANNFTVDGSDNNDEDIGVRRQGFVSLIPQTIESIKEYQAITLLAPAQYGRNLGAQVNAVSRAGGNDVHGSLYSFFNSSGLNARNYFDTVDGDVQQQLFAGNRQQVKLNGTPVFVRNQGGGEDSFTFGKLGGVVGGPVRRERTFYFLSVEGQVINASKEESFAVPTVEERGAFGRGATGIFENPFDGTPLILPPLSTNSNYIYSLFPFANHLQGIYGRNTLTKLLPARARGTILSAKVDDNFQLRGWKQTVTGRYNFTDDWREIPSTGDALASSIRPEVRTQNFSFFVNGQLSAEINHQLRFSYGRTRLHFIDVPDRDGFLIPSRLYPGERFLLNANLIVNCTEPAQPGIANIGDVKYQNSCIPNRPATTVESFGPLGQVRIAGFSPVGVDVYNFPQQRVNNTYQLAGVLGWITGDQTIEFGIDERRSELHSDLPRLARPLVTFNGGPRLIVDANGQTRLPKASDLQPVLRPLDMVALASPSAFFLTLLTTPAADPHATGAEVSLRYHQHNLFLQDDWQFRDNLSLTFGLRYEYNTPPKEINGRIERTFSDPALAGFQGLAFYLEGRQRIFDPDRNNFAPRLGLAYSPHLLGKDRLTVIRAGYGLFYDQILGAVVSQSRNVFPTFMTLNYVGLSALNDDNFLTFTNPATTNLIGGVPLVREKTINHLNYSLNTFLAYLRGGGQTQAFPDALGLTLPVRRLRTPMAHHYTFAIEQQLSQNWTASAAYVGTLGRKLLRLTTPNLGPGATVAVNQFLRDGTDPAIFGRLILPPRKQAGIGSVNLYETNANSYYDSLQVQLIGRHGQRWQLQTSYTLARAFDDVSDIFDLAGAYALPQNSLTFIGERGPANFDIRHRLTHYLIYDLTPPGQTRQRWVWLRRGLQLSTSGRLQTGQPFTVNSTLDVNLDGNLTDRLNTTNGLTVTGDGRQPLRLNDGADPLSLLAPFGQDGGIRRNSFRAGNLIELDLAVIKQLTFAAGRQFSFRVEFFNLFDRANFGVPDRLLESPGFGKVIRTVTPGLRVQLGLKYAF